MVRSHVIICCRVSTDWSWATGDAKGLCRHYPSEGIYHFAAQFHHQSVSQKATRRRCDAGMGRCEPAISHKRLPWWLMKVASKRMKPWHSSRRVYYKMEDWLKNRQHLPLCLAGNRTERYFPQETRALAILLGALCRWARCKLVACLFHPSSGRTSGSSLPPTHSHTHTHTRLRDEVRWSYKWRGFSSSLAHSTDRLHVTAICFTDMLSCAL